MRELAAGPERQRGITEQEIWSLFREVFWKGSGRELVIQWVLSHCDLAYNDAADKWAKQGTTMEQGQVAIGLRTVQASVRRQAEAEWTKRR